jgi:hypothetical protein
MAKLTANIPKEKQTKRPKNDSKDAGKKLTEINSSCQLPSPGSPGGSSRLALPLWTRHHYEGRIAHSDSQRADPRRPKPSRHSCSCATRHAAGPSSPW